jgi:hypothetical protein
VQPARARAINKRMTGSVEDRATATFADSEAGSFDVTFGVVGALDVGESCDLASPSNSCSFLSLQHSVTSWPCMLQWVHHFLAFSVSFSLVFLAALVKNAVVLIPDSQIQCCSSAKIWALSSAGKASSLVFVSMVYKVLREAGRADMIVEATMSSPKFDPRFLAAWTD